MQTSDDAGDIVLLHPSADERMAIYFFLTLLLFLPYLTMLTIYKGGHATVDLLPEVSLPPKAVIALMCESPCPLRRSIILHFHVLQFGFHV